MKTRLSPLVICLTAILSLIITQSCEKEENNVTNISSYDSGESHNLGYDCMACHKAGGAGKGWFVVAGSVYDSTMTSQYPGATVRLYTGQNGTGELITTVEVDKKGNFYTTENVDFGDGLYPSVEGATTTQYMSSSITTGACNSCHGKSTDKLWTK